MTMGAVLPYEIFLMVVEAVIDNAVAQSSMELRVLNTARAHELVAEDVLTDDGCTAHLIVQRPTVTELSNRFHLIRDIRQVNRQARFMVEERFFQLPAAVAGHRIQGCLPFFTIWTCPQIDAFAYPSINEFPENDQIFGLIESVTMKANHTDVERIANCALAMPKLRFIYLTPSEMFYRSIHQPAHNHAEDLPLDLASWPDLGFVPNELTSAKSQILWDRNIRVIFARYHRKRLERVFELVCSSDVNPHTGEDDRGLRMRFCDLECSCCHPTEEEIATYWPDIDTDEHDWDGFGYMYDLRDYYDGADGVWSVGN